MLMSLLLYLLHLYFAAVLTAVLRMFIVVTVITHPFNDTVTCADFSAVCTCDIFFYFPHRLIGKLPEYIFIYPEKNETADKIGDYALPE